MPERAVTLGVERWRAFTTLELRTIASRIDCGQTEELVNEAMTSRLLQEIDAALAERERDA